MHTWMLRAHGAWAAGPVYTVLLRIAGRIFVKPSIVIRQQLRFNSIALQLHDVELGWAGLILCNRWLPPPLRFQTLAVGLVEVPFVACIPVPFVAIVSLYCCPAVPSRLQTWVPASCAAMGSAA